MNNIEEIRSYLKENNQEHILLKYDSLTEKEKNKLISQINNLDFDLINKLYNSAKSEVKFEDVLIEPISCIVDEKISKNDREKYKKMGIKSIQDSEYAVVTMAGGQGTRLGHTGPKGSYKLLENGKSLFELLCDNLKDAYTKYGKYINWYIMTSEENNFETIAFFEENNYFGYSKDHVKFFIQGKLPMLAENGDILLDENGLINEAANGHGGTLLALSKTGVLEDMKKNNIKWVYVSGVDNILAKLVDPNLIGISIENNSNITVKSVIKSYPEEKAGVLCKKNGKTGVIEYTEITQEMANLRDNFGEYVYGDLNILLYLFNINALEEISQKELPYHTAHKKANYISRDGEYIIAKEPNAYKFESFIFDSFDLTDNILILRVKREDEFAPLKNAIGVDSPETAKKLYYENITKVNSLRSYEEWINNPIIDNDTKEELIKIADNIEEIKDRFYKELEFGTAGLRGIMGAGTNRMNKYTVSKATQGLANYIKELKREKEGVVICYDTRNNSKEFAKLTALTLNANGIKTYIFDNERPVPVLSYAVRLLKCAAGIMITASHNPPEYNGYKVYWDNGAQIISPVDNEILDRINKITDYSLIKNMKLEDAKASKLYNEVGNSVEEFYLKELEKNILNHDNIINEISELKVVYTPLHGTGNTILPKFLKKLGYNNLYVVPEQELPNGNFPTVKYPNPEDKNAFEMAINLANEIGSDICFATDPDADRFGIMLRDKTGEFKALNGNQIAVLILEYILENMKKNNSIKENSVVISTIVSTNLTKEICKNYNVEYLETLTGFKYMGNMIDEYSKAKKENDFENSKNFIFGFEESFGFLYGTHARDKDGVIASVIMLEMIAYYKSKGITIFEQLENIYSKYGYYLDGAKTLVLKGENGQKQINSIMNKLRTNIPNSIANINVIRVRDYNSSKTKDIINNIETDITLPKSNVLYFELENDMFIAIRPSGTEPKLKFYIGTNSKTRMESEKILKELDNYLDKLINDQNDSNNKLNFKERK